MKIKAISNRWGRDLYGTMECEHCGATEKLTGGYDDAHWHQNVLPTFHCQSCKKNRAGETPSAEVQVANEARGVYGVGGV